MVRKLPASALVRQGMRYVLLLLVLAVLVFLGNMMWVTFFGGRSLFG
ncbi:MAG TPA: hypothetical protein VGU71_17635 [Candidatus Dormibacteraeota bacterium]|nr:hypothetical protein [Candidatus Dormibacteraeota bacterium]